MWVLGLLIVVPIALLLGMLIRVFDDISTVVGLTMIAMLVCYFVVLFLVDNREYFDYRRVQLSMWWRFRKAMRKMKRLR